MLVLGIETSCDETAAAVVRDGRRLLSSVVSSQVELHARYGGVVPELASRQHVEAIIPVLDEALAQAGCSLADIDAVAVTTGPGLAGALLVGANAAKAIAYALDLPLVAVNHLEGHIYAAWLQEAPAPRFPVLCLIVSGGHTDLVLMTGHGRYQRLGETADDAAGEAFDKVARLLGLGFPGGPAVERLGPAPRRRSACPAPASPAPTTSRSAASRRRCSASCAEKRGRRRRRRSSPPPSRRRSWTPWSRKPSPPPATRPPARSSSSAEWPPTAPCAPPSWSGRRCRCASRRQPSARTTAP